VNVGNATAVVSITVPIYSQSPLRPSKTSASSFAESALSLLLFNLPVRSSGKKNLVEHGNGRYEQFRQCEIPYGPNLPINGLFGSTDHFRFACDPLISQGQPISAEDRHHCFTDQETQMRPTPTAGTYTLHVCVASDVGGGVFHLTVDGQHVTPAISVPQTNGWQTWQTLDVPNVRLPQGAHTLQLIMDTCGFFNAVGNFNWFSID
jgi:Carbohydrate binding module (family 6)